MQKIAMGVRVGLSVGISLAGLLALGAAPAGEADQAKAILAAAGVKGGLVVHLGCGDGKLTAALRAGESYLVHGLDADARNVEAARKHIQSLGFYGPVSVDRFDGRRLPYADNLVNLVVADALGDVPMAEVMRVLAPGGVAYVGGQKTVKPRPKEMDEWTHYLYDASNNAVCNDTLVGPPRHIQWVGGPAWARSHDHLASVSALVSAGGRIFYIADEGPVEAVVLPPKWVLVAQDAFSGVVLWKRPIGVWEWHLRGFRSGPPEIGRRLVAIADRVYVTLGYGSPVAELDSATGETLKTYQGTDGTSEIIHSDGTLYLVAEATTAVREAEAAALRAEEERAGKIRSQRPAYRLDVPRKRILAVEAASGKQLWQKSDGDTAELMPTTLAVAGGRLFFQGPEAVICLDAASGKERWRAERPTALSRPAWTAPTLVVHGGIVYSADRSAAAKPAEPLDGGRKVEWLVSSAGGQAPVGEIIAYAAETGQRLWHCPAKECYNAPVDVLIAGGLLWTGQLVQAKEPGITEGRDPRTGEVKRTRPADQEFFLPGMGHGRCHRNRATPRFLVLGRSGVEFIDVATGEGIANHWVRGTCQYGVMPANGLLYAPPHSCACFIEAKLNGFYALAPTAKSKVESLESKIADAGRLEKGPAYAEIGNRKSEIGNGSKWPTYRGDAARSGVTGAAVPAKLAPAWQAQLGGRLTSVVVAEGKLFVASIDAHTVHALDAASGKPLWAFTAGGRIDSPPTIHDGLALFGSADGYAYAVRTSDGALAWRFRAAPEDRRVVAYGQLESVWPVPGNILVQDGIASFAAGRSSYLDGGMRLYRLDARTGKLLSETRLDDRDPKTGYQPKEAVKGTNIPGALPDVLASDGTSLYLRHLRFDRDGQPQPPNVSHLFSPAGFLDDAWWHRTYWLVGMQMGTNYGGWPNAGNRFVAGRLLVKDGTKVYGFGRDNYIHHGSHVGIDGATIFHFRGPSEEQRRHTNYRLFAATTKVPRPEAPPSKPKAPKKAPPPPARAFLWTQAVPMFVRAMVLAGDVLFIAGSPDPVSAWRQGKASGPALWAVAPADGAKLAEYPLGAAPVWDAMAAAGGRLFLATQDGKVLCFGGKE